MADYEKSPSWDPKRNIPLGGSKEMLLDCAVPLAEGSFTGKYGKSNWHLWIGSVEEESNVWWKDEKKEEKDFKGKVSFFPSDKLNDKLIEVCNGEKGVKVKISRTAVENNAGKLITVFGAEKLAGGVDLSRDEQNFVNDIKNLKADGTQIEETTLLQVAKDDYKIEEGRAKELIAMV